MDPKRPTIIQSENLADMQRPGFAVVVDPDIAEEMGAFEETALTEADVDDSQIDAPEE